MDKHYMKLQIQVAERYSIISKYSKEGIKERKVQIGMKEDKTLTDKIDEVIIHYMDEVSRVYI